MARGKNIKTHIRLAAKADYLSGMSRSEIAERHGINPESVTNWVKREGWKRSKLKTAEEMLVKVDRAMTARAETMAERGAQFLERCAKESESWLDTVQTSKALVSPADVAAVSQLIQAWKVPIAVGRQTYGLDQENQGTRVQVAVFSKDGVEVIAKAQTSQSPDVDVQDGQT